jgi:hypothetical protein
VRLPLRLHEASVFCGYRGVDWPLEEFSEATISSHVRLGPCVLTVVLGFCSQKQGSCGDDCRWCACGCMRQWHMHAHVWATSKIGNDRRLGDHRPTETAVVPFIMTPTPGSRAHQQKPDSRGHTQHPPHAIGLQASGVQSLSCHVACRRAKKSSSVGSERPQM